MGRNSIYALMLAATVLLVFAPLNNRLIVEARVGDSAAAMRDRDKLSRCRK